MDIPEKIFKAYDIRGIYPTEINENNIGAIIKAIYAFFRQQLQKDPVRVVLGTDMRVSSPALVAVAKQTLIDAGAHVIDVGLVSTPSFYFAVSHYGYDTGIQVTASHNPKEYNGVKFVMNSPSGLIKIGKSTGMEDVQKMSIAGVTIPSSQKGTMTQKTDILTDEIAFALEFLHNPVIKKYTIVADPANAMGAQYIEAIFSKVPGELIKMNFELDGTFPVHQPDPLDFKNLVDLQQRVVSEKADLGLAPDGDGDRLFFIDEKGQVVPATIISSIIARELLKYNPGAKMLFDIRYILTPAKIVEEYGGSSEITKVGHAFITESMTKTGALFAGESSAHYYYQATGNAESAVITILTVLKVLSDTGKTLSQLVHELRRSYESGEFNFKVTNASEILQSLKETYSDGELSTLDGIAISYRNWRFNVRTSNTEPLLRLNLEALTKEVMEQKRDEVVSIIKNLAQE